MGERTHTPGPWAVTGISMSTGSISVGQRDQRIVIADVTNAASFGDMLGGAMRRGGGKFDQADCSTQHANARLIAAAPDMFEALKAARQFIANGVELGFIRMPDAGTPDPAHDTLPVIEAALAKASPHV